MAIKYFLLISDNADGLQAAPCGKSITYRYANSASLSSGVLLNEGDFVLLYDKKVQNIRCGLKVVEKGTINSFKSEKRFENADAVNYSDLIESIKKKIDTKANEGMLEISEDEYLSVCEKLFNLIFKKSEENNTNENVEHTNEYLSADFNPEQVIYYGAPGTGKSFEIRGIMDLLYKSIDDKNRHCKRVTFYSDYEYTDFVGSLRPVRNTELDYEFVPGPLTLILTDCFNNPDKKYFLIIEELNRGNAAAIFGDLFQLLDRDSTGKSAYSVINKEIADYVNSHIKYKGLLVNDMVWFPNNFNILCTMNTADQNVFVLDTAFTRRFERKYIPIDFLKVNSVDNDKYKSVLSDEIDIFKSTNSSESDLLMLYKNTEMETVLINLSSEIEIKRNWITFASIVNAIIDAINTVEGTDQISEDKKLGPFFVNMEDLKNREAFVNKVIYYLKQDVFKYEEKYFNKPYNSIYRQYGKGESDLFKLLKVEE